MLRTTTRKARENIRAYILNGFTPENYDERPAGNDFASIARFILEIFRKEMPDRNRPRVSEQQRFEEWCSGLPSLIDCGYYYNRSAVSDLAAILEETPEESASFSESDAEMRLTWLIYRELTAAERQKVKQ